MGSLDDSLDTQRIADIRFKLFGHPPQLAAYLQQLDQNTARNACSRDDTPFKPHEHDRPIPEPSTTSPITRDDASPKRAATISQYALPRLMPSKSSPNMPIAVKETSSQLRMYYSFAGFPDGGGDTQPMDSQIYRDYSSMIKSRAGADETVDTIGRLTCESSNPPKTYNEGDTGHVDLVTNWEQDLLNEHVSSDTDEEAEDLDPETQLRVQSQITSPNLPKTPATAGQKRNYRGEVISSITKTPGPPLASFFANGRNAPVMSLSQVFNATQAPSSPLQDALRSDPVFQRPSPNFTAARQSSLPIAPPSSPTRQPQSDFQRSSVEPRDAYTTMKESQEMRARRLREEAERKRLKSEGNDEFEEWIEEEQRGLQQRKQAGGAEKLRTDSAGNNVPQNHAVHRGRGRQSEQRRLKSPRGIMRDHEVVEISDDPHAGDEDDEEPPLSDVESGPDGVEKRRRGPASSGMGLQVPMTSSRAGVESRGRDSRERVSDNGESTDPVEQAVATPEQRARLSQQEPKSLDGTQTVADSQPGNGMEQESLPVPPTLREPSSLGAAGQIVQARISQASAASKLRIDERLLNALDTSSVPRAPQHTSQLEVDQPQDDESRMPSSPPMLPVIDEGNDEYDDDESLSGEEEEVDLVGEDMPQHGIGRERLGVDVANRTDTSAVVHSLPCPHDVRRQLHQGIRDRHLESANSTIQETDPIEPPASSSIRPSGKTDGSLSVLQNQVSTNASGTTSTNPGSTGLFETAPSHFSASPRKKQFDQAPRASKEGAKMMHIRKLTDIAAEATPDDLMGDIDMDINIMTEEDNHFTAIMSGSSPVHPARKRRKVYSSKASRSPVKRLQQQEQQEQQERQLIPPSSSPPPQRPLPSLTSTQDREEQGAQAAVQARQIAIKTRQPISKPGKLNRPAHKMHGLLAKKNELTPVATVRTNQAARRVLEVAETSHEKPNTTLLQAAPNSAPKPTRRAGPKDDSTEQQPEPVRTDRDDGNIIEQMDDQTPTVPNRVLARFNGGKMAYYPATCIGMSPFDGPRFRIRFDDGTIDDLDAQHVRRLELKVGDVVKVDLDKLRTKTYVMRGFKKRTAVNDAIAGASGGIEAPEYPLTDIYGHNTIVLAAKQRDNLPTDRLHDASENVDVPLASIYITTTMWSHFRDRVYNHPSDSLNPKTHLSTPSNNISVPTTPTTRSRRLTTSTSHARDTSTASSHTGSTLFAGMAFAVTFSGTEDEKDAIVKLIFDNGGRLLNDGFDSLFHIPSADTTNPTSPTKSPRKPATSSTVTADKSDQADAELSLTSTAEHLGFVALIADRHSRRAKYMQALALGLPCLAGRWIRDCVRHSRILGFGRYLLPAGESSFLGGAVRSRVLTPYAPSTARFKETVEGRPKLLEGRSVLLVMGKGRAGERRKAYLFLTYALGAKRVGRVRDLEAAKRLLDAGDVEWDWLYVDGAEAEAQKILSTGSNEVAGRKRKRGDGGGGSSKKTTDTGKAKIVSDEFVIQSLILGALLEE